MTALEADKVSSVGLRPSFPGHRRPRAGRSGQVGTVPHFIVQDSYSLHMLLKTGQLRVTLWTLGCLKKNMLGVRRTRRLPSAPAAIYSVQTTLLSPKGENWIKGIAASKLNNTIKMQIFTGYTISCCRRRQ